MKRFNRFIEQLGARALVGTMGALLMVCSASGASNEQQVATERLAQAKVTFAAAKNSTSVESYAMKQLLMAEKTLNEAEAAKKKALNPNPASHSQGYSAAEEEAIFADVARLAYLANRQAEGAIAFAEGLVAENDKLRLGREIAEVRLLKSAYEKQGLQRDVAVVHSALERSREELTRATNEAERSGILADIEAKEALLAKAQAAAKGKQTEEALALAAAKGKETDEAWALAAASATDARQARSLASASAHDAEKAKAELAQLLKELSELQGQLTDRGIVLTIGDVLFATGKANLNPSAQGSMDKIAQFLAKNPNRHLLVEGYTDSVGSDGYNQGLSEQRAAAVKSALVRHEVADERMVAIGYGERFPISGNDLESGRQQNRRVEVVILNEGVKPESQFRK